MGSEFLLLGVIWVLVDAFNFFRAAESTKSNAMILRNYFGIVDARDDSPFWIKFHRTTGLVAVIAGIVTIVISIVS